VITRFPSGAGFLCRIWSSRWCPPGSGHDPASLPIAPVTTTVRNIPTEVRLAADDGLPRECAANFDNVFTLSRSRFKQRITRLAEPRLREVCRAYQFAAGCQPGISMDANQYGAMSPGNIGKCLRLRVHSSAPRCCVVAAMT
jgi:PemK-like, MazF-like toxin of type II toxin-antitoxin system